MGRTKSFTKSRARHYTHSPDLKQSTGHAKAPQRVAIIAVRAIAQELEIPIPFSLLEQITRVKPSNQTRILRSNSLRTLHNDIIVSIDS